MATDFFPQRPDAHPMIYAYEDTNPQYQGLLKVGYTAIDVDKRVAQQYPTKRPDGSVPYRIVYRESAMYPDGSSFTDHDVHRVLKRKQITGMGGEWFRCTVDDVRAAVLAVKNHTANVENRVNSFSMRPEQQEAVDKTAAYFQSAYEEDSTRYPKFLWNCKMRFGKTFASYQLAKRMGFKRILILTFKPAVVSAWQEDLNSHIDFEGWQFISRNTELTYETADKSRPIVCFGSFQDYLGVNKETGGIKAKNEWVHSTNWDLVIFDEYHFGAWKENAKKLFEQEDEDSYDSEDMDKYDRGNAYDETFLPITTMYYLYLSGTPFRALNSGEFIEDQIYNWTYSDEQRAKENWQGDGNPYAALPRMVMMTYRIPDSIRQIAMQGEFNEFDLNVFFSAKGKGAEARFVYENEVQKWLDLIKPVSSIILLDDASRTELQRWANMSDAELAAAQRSGDSIRIDVDDVIRQLEEKYALDPQLLDDLLSVFDADDLELWEEISQWEDSDNDEPTEYFFSNPDPYFKPEPLPPDRPKHNFGFDETGHIRVKNSSAFWLPEFTLQREIGGTIYTITGSYDGTETLDRKMERILTEKFTEKTEDDE